MAKISVRSTGLNTLLVVLSLFVVSGAAIIMTNNMQTGFSTGASNVTQTATGKLVKKGQPDFAPCGKTTASVSYALLGAQPETPINAKNRGVVTETTKNATPACTPLAVSASLADPLVGQRVVASGTLQNGVFYATSLKLATETPNPSGKPGATPVGGPAFKGPPVKAY